MKAKAFNPQAFLEFLCYCVFAGLMLYLVSSGRYLAYVTPKMQPYLYFTAIIMGIWAFAVLARLFMPQHRVRTAHCFVLVIPILLLLLPHTPIAASNLSGNYMGGSAFLGLSGQGTSGLNNSQTSPAQPGSSAVINEPEQASSEADDNPSSDIVSDLPQGTFSDVLPGLDKANKKITVSNDDFGLWLSEIFTNMDEYEGYTVTITGYVFKDSELLKEDEFVPARLMMSCCVADLAPAGLLCKYDKTSELTADSWVTIEGTLFIGAYEYGGQVYEDPQIAVKKITPAEPVEGYIYPY